MCAKESAESVLVTGIGGNVGQGILRNIRRSFPGLRLVGTDTGSLTAGHHFCDRFHDVPYSEDSSFGDRIANICKRESVALIIPSTDYETVYIGKMAAQLPPLLASPVNVAEMFLDKWRTFEACQKHAIPFVESALPSQYQRQWSDVVVKPRRGRGSREIHRNPENIGAFDEGFVVQRLLRGPELTSAFYVSREGQTVATMTFVRELVDGTTERCSVTREYDAHVSTIVSRITNAFTIVGPCNIQSIVDDDGQVVPFEVNCRYSGTNSIRAQFGFADVAWGVREHLYGEKVAEPQISSGSAIRILMDIVYPEKTLDQITPGGHDSYIF